MLAQRALSMVEDGIVGRSGLIAGIHRNPHIVVVVAGPRWSDSTAQAERSSALRTSKAVTTPLSLLRQKITESASANGRLGDRSLDVASLLWFCDLFCRLRRFFPKRERRV